jgi:hypothetical protein
MTSSRVTVYLFIHLTHTRLKRQDVNQTYKMMLRLLENRSSLSLDNKVLLYNAILKPIWTYGLEIWGSAKPSNISRVQTLQSKILRKICNAPFYVSNLTLHKRVKVPFVKDLAVKRYQKFYSTLSTHPNPLVQRLSSRNHPDDPVPRLRRQWPRELHLLHM